MKSDFEIIRVKLNNEFESINLYPIADLHLGSKECNEAALKRWVKKVENDNKGFVVIAGDMQNEVILVKDYVKHICTPFLNNGGYGLEGHYLPMPNERLEYFKINGRKKGISFISEGV